MDLAFSPRPGRTVAVRRPWTVIVAASMALLISAAACSSSPPDSSSSNERTVDPSGVESTPAATPSPEPPTVDLSIHSIPLTQVIFDTFDGGSVRLSEASSGTIRRLRDAIRPVYEPVRYQDVSGGDWLSDSDTVIGYLSESGASAYPINFLNSHELVNDTIDGIPVLVSYCPLCGSGVVYDLRLDGVQHVFGNTSVLYENDLVMFDHATGSYWFQVGGEAIVGKLTGSKLEPLPSTTIPWGAWKDLHPDTQILSRVQGFPSLPNYDRDPFSSYKSRVDDLRFPFPVTEDKIDTRLPASTVTVTVLAGGQEKAYPVETMGDAVANDMIAGEPIVVFSREDGAWGVAFSRQVDGDTLTFSVSDGAITDAETGTTWSLFGEGIAGGLAGASLKALPTRRAVWFSIAITVPGIEIWSPVGS